MAPSARPARSPRRRASQIAADAPQIAIAADDHDAIAHAAACAVMRELEQKLLIATRSPRYEPVVVREYTAALAALHALARSAKRGDDVTGVDQAADVFSRAIRAQVQATTKLVA